MRLKLADRDGFEPPKCQDQNLVPCHLANGLKVNLAEDTGLEPVDRINDHGIANRSIHHSGNLPKISGYEFRGRSIWVSIPSAQRERLMTSPEVERNKCVAPQEAIRTLDIRVTKAVLCQLSYKGKIHFGCVCARAGGMKPRRVLSLR